MKHNMFASLLCVGLWSAVSQFQEDSHLRSLQSVVDTCLGAGALICVHYCRRVRTSLAQQMRQEALADSQMLSLDSSSAKSTVSAALAT